jgi:hypothetical protein
VNRQSSIVNRKRKTVRLFTIYDSRLTSLAQAVSAVGAAFAARRFKLSSPEGALSFTLNFPVRRDPLPGLQSIRESRALSCRKRHGRRSD